MINLYGTYTHTIFYTKEDYSKNYVHKQFQILINTCIYWNLPFNIMVLNRLTTWLSWERTQKLWIPLICLSTLWTTSWEERRPPLPSVPEGIPPVSQRGLQTGSLICCLSTLRTTSPEDRRSPLPPDPEGVPPVSQRGQQTAAWRCFVGRSARWAGRGGSCGCEAYRCSGGPWASHGTLRIQDLQWRATKKNGGTEPFSSGKLHKSSALPWQNSITDTSCKIELVTQNIKFLHVKLRVGV